MSIKLKDRVSVEKLIEVMTVEEKALLITGSSPFRSKAMEKYGIPAMYMIDTTSGLNERGWAVEAVYQKLASEAEQAGTPLDREKNGSMGGLLAAFAGLKKMMSQVSIGKETEKNHPYAVYPAGISYGATWNPEVVRKASASNADQMSSLGIDMILGPDINIHRDPRSGRLGESVSEDPVLTAKIGVAEVKGIEQEGVLSAVKHFAANSQETDRMGVDEHISERALREIYLPAFKACADAGAASFMSAYNKINGRPSAQDDWLLTDVLRKEWRYEGFVVSDWGASYDQVEAAAAGTDLTMPGPRGVKIIEKAVHEGRLSMEQLDNCARHVLRGILRAPCFTGNRKSFSMEEAIRVTEQAAQEGLILLKNDGTLPLSRETKVACYGRRSSEYAYAVGSIHVKSDLATNPYDRIREIVGEGRVTFEAADTDTTCWIVTIGADAQEGADRKDLELASEDKAALEAALVEAETYGGNVVAVINAVGPVNLTPYESRLNAILCPFYNGMMGGKVVADAIFGLCNPAGKLPTTWPKRVQDMPAYRNFPGENKEVWYGEGIYVGYRWYDERDIAPAWPFGHGLSYTRFNLHDLSVPQIVPVEEEPVQVRLKVRNVGSMAGSEVVQVYVHDCHEGIDLPPKQLKTFAKVYLEPGEERELILSLLKEDFACYSMELRQWVTRPGKYALLVGTSSRDLPLKATLQIRCCNPFGYGDRTGVGVIVGDPRALAAVNEVTGADLRVVAHAALDYAPDIPFGNIWHGEAMQKVFLERGVTAEEAAAMRAELQRRFDEIEI